jgi:sugar lactone lactonase YvrE
MALPLDLDRSIVASRSSLHEYRWSDDTLTALGDWHFDPDIRFNDGATSPHGEIFVGTMSMDRRPDRGALMRFADGQLETVVAKVGISNGLGWISPSTACYIDSLVPAVLRLDMAGEPRLSTFVELVGDEPDGLTVSPDGDILVALWAGDRLAHLGSAGQRRADIPVPAHFPTSVAIGGAGMDVIMVTTALEDPADRSTDLDGRVLVADWGRKRP